MARILVISGDILPYPGFPTTGAGLRAWGLAHGLMSRGHDVRLAMPRSAVQNFNTLPNEHGPLLYVHKELSQCIQAQAPDIVVLQHWRLANFLHKPVEIPVVIDLHGPLLLEILFQENPALEMLRIEKIQALHKADFFTCAGEKQRYYFEPWLMMAGFDLRQELIRSVPVCLAPQLPEHQSEGELTFVYGGVFLPWQDPVLGLTTLVECVEQHHTGILKFFGGKHPVVAFPTKGFETLRNQLQQSARVRLQPMIPRDQLLQEYCRAHAAIDVMQRNVERELAFTTRTVEYLWCGLPVIYNDYAELAEYIRAYHAGWTLNPTDTTALRNVIEEIIERPECLTERSRNAQRLVRERLTWDIAIEPLDRFCRAPRKCEKTTPLSLGTRHSMLARLRQFEKKLRFHLEHEGVTGIIARGWRKLIQM